MDRLQTQQIPGHRDMVFCHECENEWYRDEHGLTCPDCHSDFTEIIEEQHDPREELQHDDMDTMPHNPFDSHDPWAGADAPDPDEDDISNMQWQTHEPQRMNFQFARTFPSTGQQYGGAQQEPFAANPLMASFATMLSGIVGGNAQPGAGGEQNPRGQQDNQTDRGPPGAQVYQGGGPGFSWTATTRVIPGSTTITRGGQTQTVDDLPTFLNQMFHTPGGAGANIGATGALGGLLANLFNPANMQHGDAVYSQEALDRIISNLMEQNTAGNAPGPASADAIANLPQKTIAESDLDEEGKADCSICMETVQLGEQVTNLPCGHWFHGECIKMWLGEHDTCPHCRSGIMPRDGPADAATPRTAEQAPRNEVNWAEGSNWGEGTSANPFTVPESPSQQQRRGNPRRTSSSASAAGLLGRMRSAFGGGGGGGGSPPGSGTSSGT